MRKRFHHLAFLLLAAALLSGLAACGANPAKSDPEPPAVQEDRQDAPAAEEAEWALPREDGMNQLTLYWHSDGADYSKCDVWIWFPGKDGSGQPFHPCAYGAKCMVNVPADVSEVGFIVRTNCSDPGSTSWGEANKDYEEDRFVVMDGDTEIYLQSGDGMQYLSTDGGMTLNAIRDFTLAGIVSAREIRYFITPAARFDAGDVSVTLDDGSAVAVESLSSAGNNVITGVITLAEPLDVSRQYTVTLKGYGSAPAVPTEIFDSQDFIDEYVYDGDDLGAVIHGSKTTFKVWAPTASAVALRLFARGDGECLIAEVPMERCEKGVWSTTYDCGNGTYYTYLVTTAAGTQEAVDPYARAAGVNGERGMVVDLDSTDPAGFANETYYAGISHYNDAVIWEVHVRDFSNRLAQSRYPGKYLAFTEVGLTNASGEPAGTDYLKRLGVTHVHLQPVYDYATVDEAKLDTPQFNWGYDPKNYNVPEGSYSTDPYHGEVRINEFKQMVHALHSAGMGVVMDVVYNHTYSLDSCLNRIVPYYYYRFNGMGAASNGSGCGNETASDRAMFRKYMVDSVVYWAKEYKVDGFRFDLMALHDIDTMQAIEQAVHAVNPKALLYGEGWTGGTSALRANLAADQKNIRRITASDGAAGSVAVFNDIIRDGLKGSVFDAKGAGFINGNASQLAAGEVIFGLCGGAQSSTVGWYVDDNMVINYMSSHDNHTLWDKLALTCPDASQEEKLAMNRLGAAAVMLSRGTPFFLAGEEMLRSKGGDSNSYMSSDAVNNIDWDALTPGSDALAMSEYYRQLIALRAQHSFLKTAEVSCRLLQNNAIEVRWEQNGMLVGVAVFNPADSAVSWTAPEGSWTVLLGGEGSLSGAVSVTGRSILFAVK